MKLIMTGILFSLLTPVIAAVSDGQIEKIVSTINNGEIKLAQYVLGNSTNAEVKKFAKHIVEDHTKNNAEIDNLSSRIAEPARGSEKSAMLEKENNMTAEQIMKLKGDELDKAYIRNQITAHSKANEEIEKKLIPEAKDEQLRAHLRETSKKVREHLSHAKAIQSKLMF